MKNDQKIPIVPSVPFACMFEQLKVAGQGNLNEWHLKCLMWSLNLNLGFNSTPFKSISNRIISNTSTLPCHDDASYCCICCILIAFFGVVLRDRIYSQGYVRVSTEGAVFHCQSAWQANPLDHVNTILLSHSCSLYNALRQHNSTVTCFGS